MPGSAGPAEQTSLVSAVLRRHSISIQVCLDGMGGRGRGKFQRQPGRRIGPETLSGSTGYHGVMRRPDVNYRHSMAAYGIVDFKSSFLLLISNRVATGLNLVSRSVSTILYLMADNSTFKTV